MAKKRERDDDWDRDFFADMFGDFDEEFRRMNDRLARFFNSIRRNPDQNIEGPFVYGFTFRQGTDGKPYFQEFGNVPEMMHNRIPDQLEQDIREPLTDINEDAANVYITYELPGISKDSIDLKVGDNSVTLSVKEGPRKYHKEVTFEYQIKPETCKAKFVNGILDVTIAKNKPAEVSGRRVTIE
jgi:HSP20 family protein